MITKELEDRLAELPKDKTVVCSCPVGIRSAMLAQVLRNKELDSKVGKSEVIGRIGSEEFCIVFLASKAEAAPICKRLLASVRSQRFTEKQLGVTISMGLTDTLYSREFESLYTEADRLLYWAKNQGRDCLVSG